MQQPNWSGDYKNTILEARRDRRPERHMFDVIDMAAAFLFEAAGNVTSQSGEDGIICALFERIGIRNRWCFEVGASDGVTFSNTLALRCDGWRSVLIESDAYKFSYLKTRVAEYDAVFERTKCVHCKIEPGDLDRILTEAGCPVDPDFGVIDIDGQDIYIWEKLECRPRVLLIEFNGAEPDGFLWGGGPWQAGRTSMLKMAKTKGYRPLMRSGVNLLLIDKAEVL